MTELANDLKKDEKNTMDTIFRNVADGGSLLDLCETWGVRYSDMSLWIQEDKERHTKYSEALNMRNEWGREEILRELRRLSKAEHTQFFNDDGKIKKPSEWTASMKSIVKDVVMNDDGEVVKVTFWNKEKALEMLGKNAQMFIEHHKVSGGISLEDLVTRSREGDE